jgi:hypothetical protein
MRIDNNTTITNPTITIQWGWNVPNIEVSATYTNERNQYGRQIGKFTYSNGWVWHPNEGNTEDVNNHFATLTIEDLNIDNLAYYTPPTPSTLRVAIPQYWEMLFPNDRFVVGGFDIALERTDNNVLCVDVAYLDWRAFQDELDKPENAALKRHMEVVWDYLKNEIEQHNFV